jgi:hypothetical protein
MWTLEPTHGLPRAAAGAAHLGAMALLLWFQELGQRLRREEHRAWWAGTGRDLLNGAGLCAIGASLWAAGYPGPAALLVAGTETLLLFGIYTFATRRTALSHPRLWSIAAGVVVCLPAIAFPEAVVGALGAVAALLFPAG